MSRRDPYDLHGQEDQQAKRYQRIRLVAANEVADVKWLMENKRGRRFAFGLLERAGVWRLSFDSVAMTMAFNEGRRSEGLRLMGLITEHCPQGYTAMLAEQGKNDDDDTDG